MFSDNVLLEQCYKSYISYCEINFLLCCIFTCTNYARWSAFVSLYAFLFLAFLREKSGDKKCVFLYAFRTNFEKINNIFENIKYLNNIKISEPLNKDNCLNLYF